MLQEFADDLKGKLPGYEWFLNAFKNIGWSNHFDLYSGEKNKQRVQIILEVIEKFISQRDDIPDFTIEHMLPDTDTIENAQIGNLIPLEERLNRRCGIKPFDQKCELYKESSYTTARNVATRYQGKPFNAEQRTAFLAKLMYNNILELNQFDFSRE